MAYNPNEIAKNLHAVARHPDDRGFPLGDKNKTGALAQLLNQLLPEEWQQNRAQAFESAVRQAIYRLEGDLTKRMSMREAGYWLFNLSGGEACPDIEPLYLEGGGTQQYNTIKGNLVEKAGLPTTQNSSTATRRVQDLRLAIAKQLVALTEDDRQSRLSKVKREALRDIDTARWPFRFIEPRVEGTPDWESLLDGCALTPNFCRYGEVVDRRLVHEGEELGIPEALTWLTSQHGRSVFLYGDRGDGKSSYINLLAARSLSTHIFLRWERPELGFDVGQLEEYRERVVALRGGRASDFSPAVVVVYSLPPYGDYEAEQQLIRALTVRQHDSDDGVIVLVDGRRGDLDRMANKVRPERISLAPINQVEAQQWASLLAKAHGALASKGMSQEGVAKRYPHLPDFLQLDRISQTERLADSASPLVVKLLQAVYGHDMWSKLHQELEDLGQEDRKAYMHICLASMAGVALPDMMLITVAPGVNLDDRSNRDPWTRDDEGRHSARHQYIAQVVLEKSWRRRRTLLRECVDAWAKNIRSGREYGGVLRKIILTVREIDPASTVEDRNDFRNVLIVLIRSSLSEVKDLAGILHSQAPDNYWHHAGWAQVFSDLVPEGSKSEENRVWLDINDSLLAVAGSLPDCPNQERINYYRIRNRIRQLKLIGTFDFDAACEAVTQLSPSVGAEWCDTGFYVDLFSCSRDALWDWGSREFQDEEIIRGKMLYESMSEAYEWYRSLSADAEQDSFGKKYGSLIAGPLHYQLPTEALAILKHSWEFSVRLESPNSRTGELYAELLIDYKSRKSGTTKVELQKEAVQVLRMVIDSPLIPSYAPYLLVTNSREEDIPKEWFLERIEVAASGAINGEAQAYLDHARALIEPDPDKRIALILEAVKNYVRVSHDKLRGKEGKSLVTSDTRVIDAWDQACRDLQRAGYPKWQECKGQYQRFSKRLRGAM